MPGIGLWVRLLRVSVSIAAGIAVLVVAARLLHVEELDAALRRVRSRLAGRADGPTSPKG
jgi:hypothetical protein